MATLRYHDEGGRECKVFWPPKTLSEVQRNYHECGCQCPDCGSEEKTMKTPHELLGVKVVYKGSDLIYFARDHQARTGASYRESLDVSRYINPEMDREYLGYEQQPAQVRTYSQAEVCQNGRTAAEEVSHRMAAVRRQHPRLDALEARHYVLSKDPALKAQYTGQTVALYEDEDATAVAWPKGTLVEWIWPKGRRRVEKISFDSLEGWTMGKVEAYLQGTGLMPKRIRQEGRYIVAFLVDPEDL